MKNLKKLLALMVALVLALAFVGCTKEEDSKEDTTTKAEEKVADEAVTKVVEDYMDALCDADFEGAMDFVDKDAKVYDKLEEKGKGPESGYDALDEVFWDIQKDIISVAEYEIESSEIEEDSATVIVSTNIAPDIDGDGNEILEKYGFEEKVNGRWSEIINENYTYEEVSAMGEDEQEQIGNEATVQATEEVWDEIKNDILEECANADMEEYTFELETDGDDWKIVNIK